MDQLRDIKLIVTHFSPDLDAVGAVWLFKRFDESEFSGAEVVFVNPGDQISDIELAKWGMTRKEVVHVDTGLGDFDHHTESAGKGVSATSLVFDYLKRKYKDLEKNEALVRMVDFMTKVDHFEEVDWPEPNNDRYAFFIEPVLKAIKQKQEIDDNKVIEFGMLALDGVYIEMERKVDAEREMGKGTEFETQWGKGIGFETSNDAVMKLGLKSGYKVVVRKDPDLENVRIKASPRKGIDLTGVYNRISKIDKKGSWYLHPEKAMLLNGSSKKPTQTPSPLSLKEIIEVLK